MVYNRVGPPVRGTDCYGRDAFVDILWDKLSAGHVLLAAPRRFGKTSIMYRLLDEPRNGYKLVHADLEKHLESADVITELVTEIARDPELRYLVTDASFVSKGFLDGFRKNISEVELLKFRLKLREEIRKDWRERGDELFERIRNHPGDIVFILDEFPMMIDLMVRYDRRQEAISFLRWMRAVRVAPANKHLHFLVAGSIGMNQVLNGLGESKSANDFENLRIDPFSKRTADAFLDELAKTHRVPMSVPVKKAIITSVGILVPYFLQILFSELAKTYQETKEAPTPKMVAEIYREHVLGVECKGYFDHYYGRLRDYYPQQEERAIKRLLRELAIQGSLKQEYCFGLYRRLLDNSDPENFNRLMTDLENDFYVRFNSTGHYEFSCKVLRDWWLRYYGLEVDR